MMMDQNQTDKINQTVGWSSADKFYDLLQELQLDMLDCRKQRDVYGMLDTLGDIYIHVYPYVEKFMDSDHNEEHELENFDDIHKIMSGIREDLNDFAARNNNDIMRECINMINQKRKILSKLMARAELNLPLNPVNTRKHAALSRDGK